jgi:hypothetical protein
VKFPLVIAGLFLAAGLLRAQDGSFSTSVDRNQLALGEQFGITFALSGSSAGNNFHPPAFTDFTVLSGPNQSTSMQFINGAVSSSVSYSYALQPRSEGTFTIGPATIEYGGKQLQSQPVTIRVTKGGAAPKAGKQQESSEIGKQIGDNLFLKVVVDKSRVVQGEQITATYKIYTRVNVVNYGLSKLPSLTGFWSEDVEVPKQIQLATELVNGKQYRVGILKKVALFPQRSGTLDLDPMEVDCVVQVQTRKRSNDIFDQFFNDPFFGNVSNVNYKVRSEPLKITVNPLPSENVPKGFAGAVGKFSMETWLDKRETKTNEPVTLKVKISGRGNLKLLEPPAVTVSTDIERYDPKMSDNIAKQGDQIAGSRTFEYLLIPRHPGDQTIPSFPFAFYDVEKRGYVALASPEFSLKVEKGTDLAASSATGISKEDVKLLGEDIRFIKSTDPALARKGARFVGSPAFVVLSLSPVLAFVSFLAFVRRRERVLGDVKSLRNRKARKMAQRRLTEAKKYLAAKKREEFYAELSRALWGYIGDKLGIPPANLSLDTVRSTLESHQVPPETVSSLAATFEQCEFARFAPSADSVEMESAYRKAIELISTIEDDLS